ncbi:hypothetical protein IJT93_01185 [bacterium]|nr:hypothetical protein [bacterium]
MEFVSPYENSHFRILGLYASAALPQIEEAAAGMRETLQRLRLEKESNPFFSPAEESLCDKIAAASYPWLELKIPSQEEADAALENLRGEINRFAARIYWPHVISDSDRQAWEKLGEGSTEAAIKIWTQTCFSDKASVKEKASACHNLAILHHMRYHKNMRGSEEAERDLQQANRWWNHCFECNYLSVIVADGEEGFALQTNMTASLSPQFEGIAEAEIKAENAQNVIKEHRDYIRQLLSYERYMNKRKGLGEAGASKNADDVLNGAQDAIGRNYIRDKANLLLAFEKAKEMTAHYKYADAVETLEKVRLCVSSEKEGAKLDEAVYNVEMARVLRGLLPIKNPPKLLNRMGFGACLGRLRDYDSVTRSFNAHLRWTVMFIPIWYFGLYRIRQTKDDEWVFLGQYVSDDFCSVYNFLVLALGVVFVIMSLIIIVSKVL